MSEIAPGGINTALIMQHNDSYGTRPFYRATILLLLRRRRPRGVINNYYIIIVVVIVIIVVLAVSLLQAVLYTD